MGLRFKGFIENAQGIVKEEIKKKRRKGFSENSNGPTDVAVNVE